MNQVNNEKSNAILKYIASEIASDDIRQNQQIRDELRNIKIPDFVKEDFDAIYNEVLQKERKELRKRRVIKISRTAAIMVLAFTVTFTVLLTSVEAFRAIVFDFFIHESEINKEIIPYKSGEEGNFNLEQRGYYSAEYIPPGYAMTESNQEDDYIILLYENEAGEWISISQEPLENRTFALNNEVDDSGEILIDNEKALWSIKEGLITIFWMHSSTAITISAQDVSFDELVKIAENIIFKK